MNTAHNKDRIIDNGLKSTLKNALALPFDIKLFINKLPQTRLGCCSNGENTDNNSEQDGLKKECPESCGYCEKLSTAGK